MAEKEGKDFINKLRAGKWIPPDVIDEGEIEKDGPGCPIEMYWDSASNKRAKCGRKLHLESKYEDERQSPVCLMHSKDPKKLSDKPLIDRFRKEIGRILDEAGSNVAHFERFVFPESNFCDAIFNSKTRLSIDAVCQFDNAEFMRDVIFPAIKFKQGVSFKKTIFNGKAKFPLTEFQQDADFSHAKFEQDANFVPTSFAGHVIFSHTIFAGPATFSSVEFPLGADFSHAEFRQGAIFNSAIFTSDAKFDSAKFSQYIDFSHAKFKDKLSWVEVIFEQKALFNNVTFAHDAYFSQIKFPHGADFSYADFKQNVFFKLETFNKEVNFSYAKFRQNLTFDGKSFPIEAKFSHAIFTHRAYFFLIEFPQGADFSHARFEQTAVFNPQAFSKKADFSHAQFKQDVIFYGKNFPVEANFSHAIFTHDAIFSRIEFFKGADFSHAEFKQDAIFNLEKLDINASFSYATFRQDVTFSGKNFPVEANFSHAIFTRDAIFSDKNFPQGADFSDAVFEQDAIFEHAKFIKKGDFSDAKFKQGAIFEHTKFKAEKLEPEAKALPPNFIFANATFSQVARFSDTLFERTVNWEGTRFLDQVEFRSTKFLSETPNEPSAIFKLAKFSNPSVVTFDNVDLSRALFHDCDISQIWFTSSVEWAKRKRGPGLRFWRWRKQKDNKDSQDNPGNAVFDERWVEVKRLPKGLQLVAEIYRQLQQNYDSRHDYQMADKFHFGEMEMRRLAAPANGALLGLRQFHRRYLSFLNLYRCVSNYGNSYARTLFWLFTTLLAFGLLLPIPGIGLKQAKSNHTVTYCSGWQTGQSLGQNLLSDGPVAGKGILASIETAAFQKNPKYAGAYPWGRLLAIIEIVFTSTLLALFLLAVRRRFRR